MAKNMEAVDPRETETLHLVVLSYYSPHQYTTSKERGSKDQICAMCGKEVETIEHMFFKCRRAQVVWKLAPVKWDGLESNTERFAWWCQSLFSLQMDKICQDRIQLSLYILWMLWKTRNL